MLSSLYTLMYQVVSDPSPETPSTMRTQIFNFVHSLDRFARASGELTYSVPTDVVQYIEAGRNPDIYTREFVEAAQRLNQERKGRSDAYAAFRDVLAKEITSNVPDLRKDVERVLRRTGG